jgi:hypothetical protein
MDLGTDFEFCSPKFRGSGNAPEAQARRAVARNLASYFYDALRDQGVQAAPPYYFGPWEQWIVPVRHEASLMWIGCGLYKGHADYFFGYINPTVGPVHGTGWGGVLRLLFTSKHTATMEEVTHLAKAINGILMADSAIEKLRWWTDQGHC